jgi:hypothetical protein
VCFCESILQNISIDVIFVFLKLNNLKVIHDLCSQCLSEILSETTCFMSMEGVSIHKVCQSRRWNMSTVTCSRLRGSCMASVCWISKMTLKLIKSN